MAHGIGTSPDDVTQLRHIVNPVLQLILILLEAIVVVPYAVFSAHHGPIGGYQDPVLTLLELPVEC